MPDFTMSPEIKNRRPRDVNGGAAETIIRAEVKAEDHMSAKPSPMRIARMSMSLSVPSLRAFRRDHSGITGRVQGTIRAESSYRIKERVTQRTIAHSINSARHRLQIMRETKTRLLDSPGTTGDGQHVR